VVAGANVRLGYMAQEQEELDPRLGAYDAIRRIAPFSETETRAFLHQFLFAGDDVFVSAGQLSFGERARLALAGLVARGCNFLLLDEPLNHLDIPSRTRFEQALESFEARRGRHARPLLHRGLRHRDVGGRAGLGARDAVGRWAGALKSAHDRSGHRPVALQRPLGRAQLRAERATQALAGRQLFLRKFRRRYLAPGALPPHAHALRQRPGVIGFTGGGHAHLVRPVLPEREVAQRGEQLRRGGGRGEHHSQFARGRVAAIEQ
jgi:hypothetical protein